MFLNNDDMAFQLSPESLSLGSSENSMTNTSEDSYASIRSEKALSPDSSDTPGKPFLKIIEEPANQFRFRYKSEMQGTHGAILGVNATKGEKTHPTVQLFNFNGEAVIRCTLYTAENKRRRPHVHRLIGKGADRVEKDDPHDLHVSARENYTARFQNLVIIHTAKKVLVDELLSKKIRISEAGFKGKLEIDPSVLDKMRSEAQQEYEGMNMNSVSLKFEALILVGRRYIQICDPVYSQPIKNMKSHVTGQLSICKISKFFSSCEGEEEILLFVEKVGKNNIKVLFIEYDDEGNEIWRDYATHLEVHRQFGIVCRCPKYKSEDITREVRVKMQLERPSDGARSEPRDFVYKPKAYCNAPEGAKRRRLESNAYSPQIPDSTNFMANFSSAPSTILMDSNTDPIFGKFPLENDYFTFVDNFWSCPPQEDIDDAPIRFQSASASSSLSFSKEYEKIPSPSVNAIQELSNFDISFLQEDHIASEHGGLVPDSVLTSKQNLKPMTILTAGRWTPFIPRPFTSKKSKNMRYKDPILVPQSSLGPPGYNVRVFAKHTLERLQQIVDTIVFPDVTKISIQNKLFLEFKTRSEYGDSVLHSAIRLEQFKLMKQLLDFIKKNVDDICPIINCENDYNKFTPLHVAVQSQCPESIEILEYLLELGADPNKPSSNEFTPLHLAVKTNNLRAAKCLLEFPGININQVSANLGTALHIAAIENRYEMAELLIENGADINSIDLQRGETSLHVAAKMSSVQIVDLLLKQNGIKINKEDYGRQTPLGFAIQRAGNNKLMKIVNKLINHGASLNAREASNSLKVTKDTEVTRKLHTLALLFSEISLSEDDANEDECEEDQSVTAEPDGEICYYIVE